MGIKHKFGIKSTILMEDMHPDLRRVFYKALLYSKYDFGVTEVLRDEVTQKANIKSGKSWSMTSKHFRDQDGWVRAGDIVVYKGRDVTWEPKYYRKVIQAFVRAAIEESVQVGFGGLWESVFDGPHVQMEDY